MKKLTILILFELVFIQIALCSYVDTAVAKKVAINFYLSRLSQTSQSKLKSYSLQQIEIQLVHQEYYDSKKSFADPYYYVFNVKENKGFIIVSAENRVIPILGYSLEGEYRNDDQPPAFTYWMNNYKDQIRFVKNSKRKSSIGINPEWSKYLEPLNFKSTSEINEVSPLISTKWGQGCYFNDFCPNDTDGSCGHAVTGCVATAMAQLMKYHNFPVHGNGSNQYVHPVYGTLSANFLFSTYNWQNMPNILSQNNDDVAKLIYHTGISVNMYYNQESSGAYSTDVKNALVRNFNYNSDIKYLRRNDYPDSIWRDKVINELQNLRPLYYAGGSHAFICDGFQTTNYFHFNWGWSGYLDGYYYLDILLPGSNFTNNQLAIFNVRPSSDELIKFNFSDLNVNANYSDISIADFDNNDSFDLIIANRYHPYVKILLNKDSSFIADETKYFSPLFNWPSSLHSFDFNSNNKIDVLNAGIDTLKVGGQKIYLNYDTGFVIIQDNFYKDYGGSTYGGLSSGDFDNDGDNDVYCSQHLFINDSCNFNQKIYFGYGGYFAKTIDYNKDGRFDLLLSNGYVRLYKNTGNNNFQNIVLPFYNYQILRASCDDLNNDGYADIIILGQNNENHYILNVYENVSGNSFILRNSFEGLRPFYSALSTGDINNDGSVDIICSGKDSSANYKSIILLNNSNFNFDNSRVFIKDLDYGDIELFDFDNDHDLDILTGGMGNLYLYKIFNDSINMPPQAPLNLSFGFSGDTIILSWDISSDDKTPSNELTYNICVGSRRDSFDIISPMANLKNGKLKIPKKGNALYNNFYKLTTSRLKAGKYYYRVQAVDNSFNGSEFSTIDSLSIFYRKSINLTVCEGDSFIYNNKTYSSAGVYYDTIYADRVDSVIQINVTINPRNVTNLIKVICQRDSISIGDSVFSKAGNYSVSLMNWYGCDSIVNLNLTVNPVNQKGLIKTICLEDSIIIGKTIFKTTGNYSVTLTNQFGCDSVVSLDLTVNPENQVSLNRTICDGDSLKVGNSIFKTAGNYSEILTNQFGCDSIVNLNLAVNPTNQIYLLKILCLGDSFQVGNSIFKTTGNYSKYLNNQYGCDSIINLDLIIKEPEKTSLTKTICKGDSIKIGNSVFKTSGSYSVTLSSQYGCDSIVSLNLIVNSNHKTSLEKTICQGDSVKVGNSIFKTAGNYSEILTNQFGCDSIVNLNLAVNPTNQIYLLKILCLGDSFQVGNSIFKTTGNYFKILTNKFGCDSLIRLNLFVNEPKITRWNKTICQGDYIRIGNSIFNKSGNYSVLLTDQFGCDSVVTLNLTVKLISQTYLSKTICQGDSIKIGHSVFKSTGIYSEVFTGQNGCDSIINLNLSVNPTNQIYLFKTICLGDSFQIGNSIFKSTGSYFKTFVNYYGCDSMVNLNLTVKEPERNSLTKSICQGDSIKIGESVFKTPGNYSVIFTGNQGCDSIINLNLTVNSIPSVDLGADKVIAQNDTTTLSSNKDFSSYTWSTGETTRSIKVIGQKTGTGKFKYWLKVTNENNCVSSDTIFITVNKPSNINSFISTGSVKFYPNPTKDFLYIEFKEINEKITVEIISEKGMLLFRKNYNEGLKVIDKIDMKKYISGWYIIKFQTVDDIKINKFLYIR